MLRKLSLEVATVDHVVLVVVVGVVVTVSTVDNAALRPLGAPRGRRNGHVWRTNSCDQLEITPLPPSFHGSRHQSCYLRFATKPRCEGDHAYIIRCDHQKP